MKKTLAFDQLFPNLTHPKPGQGNVAVQIPGTNYSIHFTVQPSTGALKFSYTQHPDGKRGGKVYGQAMNDRVQDALAAGLLVPGCPGGIKIEQSGPSTQEALPFKRSLDEPQGEPHPASQLPDEVARALYNRFSRLRHGGSYPSMSSRRAKDTAEPFNPDRVRQLVAEQHPATQAWWCSQIGYTI